MTFPTTIQGFTGAHTSQSTGNTQCAPDWFRLNLFIVGDVGAGPTPYISRSGLFSGIETAFKDLTTYSHNCNQSATVPTVGIQGSGDVILAASYGLNGGGSLLASGVDLSEITVNGQDASLPFGYFLQGASIANSVVGSTQFNLYGFNILDANFQVMNRVTFAGLSSDYVGSNINCVGSNNGIGLMYAIAGPNDPGESQFILLYRIIVVPGGTWTPGDWPTPNPNLHSQTVQGYFPTDIDAGWTQIEQTGIAIDQTDGNILIIANGNNTGGAHNQYIFKVSSVTGTIVWKVPIDAPIAVGGRQFQYSSIVHQRVYIFHTSPNTLIDINTADGSFITITSGFDNITGFGNGQQCSNDNIGAVLFLAEYDGDLGTFPVRLNSTPKNYTAWSLMYVEPPLKTRLFAQPWLVPVPHNDGLWR